MKKVKIGDVKQVNNVDYICKGFTQSGKPQWRRTDEEIKKAKSVGDVNKKGEIWTEYQPGKFDWRPKSWYEKKGKQIPGAGGGASSGGSATSGAPASKQTATAGGEEKKTPAAPQKKIEDMSPDELVDYAKNASTEALSKVVNDKKADPQLRQLAFNQLKTRSDYDRTKVDSSDLKGGYVARPKAKSQYKTKTPGVDVPDFENYEITTNTGQRKTVDISGTRKLYASYDDAKLLNILNNKNGDYKKRQLAYDEAAARGIDEDKIEVGGTLANFWKRLRRSEEIANARNKVVNEDEAMTLEYDWKGIDHEAIMRDNFDGGEDTEWLDANSERVRRIFNTDTLAGRQKYDTFKDYYQRDPKLVPGYLNAQNKVNNLNGEMWEWAQSDSAPLFISAGGAGAGKTYGWKEIVADDLSIKELEPGDDPENGDWGYVMLTDEQASDEKTLSETLATYNGTYWGSDGKEHPHILVFDDADKILITRSKGIQGIMKKICDGNPNARIFTNPKTGKPEVWRGKIIIMTNKDIAKLQNGNEDAKAIISRGTTSDIQFTRNETMELLSERYMDMSLRDCATAFERGQFTEDEIQEFRQDVFDYMQEHVTDADPAKFTPRSYINLCKHIAPKWKAGSNARQTGKGTIGTTIPWEVSALSIIKANDNDIEKADSIYSKEHMVAVKENLERMMSDAKKSGKFDKLFGRKAQDAILFGSQPEDESDGDKKKAEKKKGDGKKSAKKAAKKSEEAKKAMDDEMSLQEAEEILFG